MQYVCSGTLLFFAMPFPSILPCSVDHFWILPRNSCIISRNQAELQLIPSSLHQCQHPMDTTLLLALSRTLSQNSLSCCLYLDSVCDVGLCHVGAEEDRFQRKELAESQYNMVFLA